MLHMQNVHHWTLSHCSLLSYSLTAITFCICQYLFSASHILPLPDNSFNGVAISCSNVNAVGWECGFTVWNITAKKYYCNNCLRDNNDRICLQTACYKPCPVQKAIANYQTLNSPVNHNQQPTAWHGCNIIEKRQQSLGCKWLYWRKPD